MIIFPTRQVQGNSKCGTAFPVWSPPLGTFSLASVLIDWSHCSRRLTYGDLGNYIHFSVTTLPVVTMLWPIWTWCHLNCSLSFFCGLLHACPPLQTNYVTLPDFGRDPSQTFFASDLWGFLYHTLIVHPVLFFVQGGQGGFDFRS